MALSEGIKLIVGLGNIGKRYSDSRHNVGFWFADGVVKQYNGQFSEQPNLRCQSSLIRIDSHSLWVIKPMTMMNLSGDAVRYFMDYYRISSTEMLVAFDDLDLPAGKFRFRFDGGHGGHLGVKHILQCTKESNFLRLRFGIGRPTQPETVVSHVLGNPSCVEKKNITDLVRYAIDTVPTLVAGDIENAATQINTHNIPI